jgi:hypothetical protein
MLITMLGCLLKHSWKKFNNISYSLKCRVYISPCKRVQYEGCVSEGKCARPPMGSEKRLAPRPPPNQIKIPALDTQIIGIRPEPADLVQVSMAQFQDHPPPPPHQGLRTSFPRIKAIPRSIWPQRRHSAKLFLQSPELGLPHPQASVPPPFGSGAVEELGESQFRRARGHTLWYSVYISTLCIWP